jgi:hypothetical protein
MEHLRKATYARNTPIIVPSKSVDRKNVRSFAVIFLTILLMFSTWMVVASVRCEKFQVPNNMLSDVMVVFQLIMMSHVHRTKFKDKGQVGWPIPHLMAA